MPVKVGLMQESCFLISKTLFLKGQICPKLFLPSLMLAALNSRQLLKRRESAIRIFCVNARMSQASLIPLCFWRKTPCQISKDSNHTLQFVWEFWYSHICFDMSVAVTIQIRDLWWSMPCLDILAANVILCQNVMYPWLK